LRTLLVFFLLLKELLKGVGEGEMFDALPTLTTSLVGKFQFRKLSSFRARV
jgi:hypothetical protein